MKKVLKIFSVFSLFALAGGLAICGAVAATNDSEVKARLAAMPIWTTIIWVIMAANGLRLTLTKQGDPDD